MPETFLNKAQLTGLSADARRTEILRAKGLADLDARLVAAEADIADMPPLTQYGATAVALDGSGRGVITFGTAFSAAPTIVVSVTLSTSATMTAHVVSKSASDFTVQVDANGTPAASVTRQVNWVAIGSPA